MGYDTKLKGSFWIDPPLNAEDKDWLFGFYEERHVPKDGKPGYWCKWLLKEYKDKMKRWVHSDNELVWDGGEKFYNYIEWIDYLIVNFFKPRGYILNGVVKWQGSKVDDRGKIVVKDNEVEVIDLE